MAKIKKANPIRVKTWGGGGEGKGGRALVNETISAHKIKQAGGGRGGGGTVVGGGGEG